MEYMAMLKQIMTSAAVAAVTLALSVVPHATAQTAAQDTSSFLQQQTGNEWRSSKLVGTTVRGPDNQSIGEIDDLLVDENGNVKAVVVGVGGFLAIGEKHVAIPFKTLKIAHTSDGKRIDHASVPYNKDQLKNAPSFKYSTSSR
jgi:hypothetical protein